jgi:hypothetical protein
MSGADHTREHEHEHDHDHGHGHGHEGSTLSPLELRVRALETVLTQKGYIDPAALDVLIDTYQTKIGPRNGAQVVARAWCDEEFRHRLFDDATAAIASLSFSGRQGEHMVALQNTPEQHNMVVCTLCSCYPWPVLGLPPAWYKSAPYRARGQGSARRAPGVRRRASRLHANSRLGFHRRSALSRDTATPPTHVFADTHARGLGEQPQWLYTVAFDERELWGGNTSAQQSQVSVDVWESYLEPA